MDTKCYYAMEDKFFAQQKINREIISVICVLAAENAELTTRIDAKNKVINNLNETILKWNEAVVENCVTPTQH